MQVFSINIQSTLWLYKLHILYCVYVPGWLNFQMWSPRVWTADLGTSTSTDFSICGGVRNQSPQKLKVDCIIREREPHTLDDDPIKKLCMGVSFWLSGKKSTYQYSRHWFKCWSGKIPQATEQLSSQALEPVLCNKRSHHNEKPAHYNEE